MQTHYRRKLIFLILLVGMSSPSFASTLAQKVQETYQNTKSVRARFVQKTRIEVFERDVQEEGTLLFGEGRFAIHYEGANPRNYLSDGKTLWIHHVKEKEVEVYRPVQDVLSREALVFLGGLGEMSKEFRVTESAKNTLRLMPKNGRAPFTKLILTVDPKTYRVSEVTLFSRGGNTSRYFFSNVEINVPVSDADFTFHEKGVREISGGSR